MESGSRGEDRATTRAAPTGVFRVGGQADAPAALEAVSKPLDLRLPGVKPLVLAGFTAGRGGLKPRPAKDEVLQWLLVRCLWFLLALGLGVGTTAGAQASQNSCLDCHSQLPPPLQVKPEEYSQSIHGEKGLTCVSCHGGDASSSDMARAMSVAAGFRGQLRRGQIPQLCASCHANATYMRGFDPSLPTDQYSKYLTSVHGHLLAKGDTNVAVCTDCHGVHDIRPPSDPRSSVYPLNVPGTCARCHANAETMKAYKIPTDQYASYTASVHYEDLVKNGDLSAPTCVTCHGAHGATPPGVSSVVNVCSTCHVFQAQLFGKSPHGPAFAAAGLPGCVTCHSNHRIVQPSDAFIGTGQGAVCRNCHSSGDAGYAAAGQIHASLTRLQAAIDRSSALLARAESSGMEVDPAKLELSEASDDLTKARVAVHDFSVPAVERETQAGMAVAQKTYAAGVAALAERDYRRKGLGISLAVIVLVIVGLSLLIKSLEAGNSQEAKK